MKDRLKILATGNQAGFTLLELMVSLLILAMVTTAVALSLPSAERQLDARATGLLGILKGCRNSSILSGTHHILSFEGDRIDILRASSDQWEKQKSFRYQAGILYQILEPSIDQDGSVKQIRFEPDGLHTPFKIKLTLAEHYRCISSVGNGQFNLQKQC